MALPTAHLAFSTGISPRRDFRSLLFLSLLSVAPDFDFALVWGLGWPIREFHRTFSHSLLFAVLVALAFAALRPRILKAVSPGLVLAVLASHAALDLLCTADAADHGVQLFWPFWDGRYGWAVLVPLYRAFAESPFSLLGALRFTLLEILLAAPLWAAGFALRRVVEAARSILPMERGPQPQPTAQSSSASALPDPGN